MNRLVFAFGLLFLGFLAFALNTAPSQSQEFYSNPWQHLPTYVQTTYSSNCPNGDCPGGICAPQQSQYAPQYAQFAGYSQGCSGGYQAPIYQATPGCNGSYQMAPVAPVAPAMSAPAYYAAPMYAVAFAGNQAPGCNGSSGAYYGAQAARPGCTLFAGVKARVAARQARRASARQAGATYGAGSCGG